MDENKKFDRRKGPRDFSGMLINKNSIVKKVVKKRNPPGDLNKNIPLSKRQLQKMDEFLKVRENETWEKWNIRTKRYRVLSEEELMMTRSGKRIITLGRKKILKYKDEQIIVTIRDKEFHFMKYYLFFIKWAEQKYGIRQNDLELGFHLYENIPLTREQFVNKCLISGTNGETIFKRFIREGYIVKIGHVNPYNKQRQNFPFYILSIGFSKRITSIYKKIVTYSDHDFRGKLGKTMSDEMQKMILEMNTEIQEIIKGTRSRDKINLKCH